MEVLKYLKQREIGSAKISGDKVFNKHVAKHLPGLLQERPFHMGYVNKIFASAWVSERQVVTGTKCNSLMVLDLMSQQIAEIPTLKSSHDSLPANCPCGIHSIAINPSRTLLATGAEHTNDVAVYRLPTLDPVCVGECGHKDWIFDITWLDDEFFVSGARDATMCLWRVRDSDCVESVTQGDENAAFSDGGSTECGYDYNEDSSLALHSFEKPVMVKDCKRNADKIRALAYNDKSGHLAAMSLDAHLHIWDTHTWRQIEQRKLPFSRENVCLSLSQDKSLYAVGSQSHVSFLDTRTFKTYSSVPAQPRGCGVRSVTFNENIVTIGTGNGDMMFYDLTASKYLECNCGHATALKASKGWLRHDTTFYNMFSEHEYPNAIYTHSYDESGTKLFAAGGPLPAGLYGNYAALWL